MKRSNMVEKIAKFIEQIRYEDAVNKSCTGVIVDSTGYACNILSIAEEAGMIPPSYQKEISKNWHPDDCPIMNRIHSSWSGNYCYTYETVKDWEPEDD